MFEKKDYIVSGSFGVCRVEKVTKLVVGREGQMEYYVLQSVKDTKKKSYIPVENPKTVLRFPMEETLAKELVANFSTQKEELKNSRFTLEDGRKMLEGAEPAEWAKGTAYYMIYHREMDEQLREVFEKICDHFLMELAFVFKKNVEELRDKLETALY